MTMIENVGDKLRIDNRRSSTASMNFEILGLRAGDVNGGDKGAPPGAGNEVVELVDPPMVLEFTTVTSGSVLISPLVAEIHIGVCGVELL